MAIDNNSTEIIAAPFTPMKLNGTVDYNSIETLTNHLIKTGVKGLFVCGSTGEGSSLTIDERKEVAAAYIAAVDNRAKVFVHVGHNSIMEGVELATHAEKTGAYAISATVPTYFKINDHNALLETMALVASGAPSLPFYYYHIPALTNMNLDVAVFSEQALKKIPNLAGVKYTSAAINDFQYCLNQYSSKLNMYYGYDELLLSALAIGARGFIGSTFNFAIATYQQVISSFEKGDMAAAQAAQLNSVELVRIIVKYGGLAAQKAIMKMIGIDCGPVRLPLITISAQQMKDMENDLQQIGFFSWANETSSAI